MKAILSDADIWWADALTYGEHDMYSEKGFHPRHIHYSILTIIDGIVTDVDWGYHTIGESFMKIIRGQRGGGAWQANTIE